MKDKISSSIKRKTCHRIPLVEKYRGFLAELWISGRIKLFCFCLVISLATATPAQSVHFSQWFNSPLTTNPANTGFIPDADYRIGANFRSQWSTIMSVPYKTVSIFGDAKVLRNKIENGWLGLGGVILNDVAGAGKLTTTKVYGSVAYHQMLGNSSLLTAGFNAGWNSKRINTADLIFPDQFDGKFFNTQLPTSVFLDVRSVNYLDVQTGMNYAYFPNDKVYLNGGIAVWHINRPRESFFATGQPGYDSRLSRRYNLFFNGSLKVSDNVILNPGLYYTTQAKASELNAGVNVQYNLGNAGEMQLLAGLYYRKGDAVIPMIGLTWNSVRVLFSFDVTTSSLSKFNQSRGAWEFSLLDYGKFDTYNGDKKQSLCPVF